jgi:hypothetical protein
MLHCLGLSADERGGKEGDTVACEVRLRLRGDMTKGESFYFPPMVGEGGGRKRGAPPPFVMATPQGWQGAGAVDGNMDGGDRPAEASKLGAAPSRTHRTYLVWGRPASNGRPV